MYCSCLWKAYLLSDIELVESAVQKRATIYIYICNTLSWQIKGILQCTYLILPCSQGIIQIMSSPQIIHFTMLVVTNCT